MKYMLTLLFFLPLLAPAQDCGLKKSTDPFTNEVKISTGFMPFNAGLGRYLISVDANSKEIDFFISLNNTGDKCFDNNSTATILYEGSKLKTNLKNTGSMNCEGLFHFTFRNTPTTVSALNRLATTKISSIQLTGNNKTVIDLALTDAEKQLFMERTACLVKEAKTLLKP
jgi:hypothetical protein